MTLPVSWLAIVTWCSLNELHLSVGLTKKMIKLLRSSCQASESDEKKQAISAMASLLQIPSNPLPTSRATSSDRLNVPIPQLDR